MNRLVPPLLLASVAAAVLATLGAPPAYACYPGPEFDALASPDVIVAGRITLFDRIIPTPAAPGQAPQKELVGPQPSVVAEMTVERAYKGTVPDTISVIDFRTDCAAFDENVDVSGYYAILGLQLRESGQYVAGGPTTFFLGPEPQGEEYDRALDRLSSLGPGTLPTSGGPPPGKGPEPWLAIAAATALLAASAFLLRRRLRP